MERDKYIECLIEFLNLFVKWCEGRHLSLFPNPLLVFFRYFFSHTLKHNTEESI